MTDFNDAYLDTWTGRRLLVMRLLGELSADVARALAEGARLSVPEAELRPVLACSIDGSLPLSEGQRERLERLKDGVLADHGQGPEATGRFPLSEARLAELKSILAS
jgi:hypothetical protein